MFELLVKPAVTISLSGIQRIVRKNQQKLDLVELQQKKLQLL